MAIFFDSNLNKTLLKEGYVIVSLLDNKEISQLEDFFYSPENKEFHQTFTTYACTNSDYKKKVDSILKEVISTKLKTIITEEMQPFWGNFMMKTPSENSNMPLHTDWQYVDEKKHISLNVWIPFTDTTLENGALHVVPKSHVTCNYPRGINLPRYYEINESKTKEKFGKALLLKKGEAIIYDHRLLHYSLPNKSDKNRLAATLVYVPKNTEIAIFFKELESDKTELFEIENATTLLESDFYTAPNSFKKRTLAVLPNWENIQVYEDLVALNQKNNTLLRKLKNWFKVTQ